jgi:hypothetical protein
MSGIEPIFRETIVNLDMLLGIIADPTLISRVKQWLTGEDDRPHVYFRFSLKFGDSLDKIELC